MAWKGFIELLLLVSLVSLSDGLATMSIDLSSEFMKIAIVKPGVPMEIALNAESQRKTPVAIAIRNGERTFGESAMSTCIRSPKHCFVFFLDLLGKDSSHELVKLYKERFPQYQLEDDPETKRVVFRVDDEVKYAPEELLAMLLKYAKTTAEKYAEQPISDAVITIPPFYTQVERIAVNYGAKLAGLNVLQLLNDNTAAALNYAVFRTKDINNTMQYLMLYDMGSTSSTATIVGYHMTKMKDGDGRAVETPQLVVKGVGYDRTLGGLEIDLRLRKFFIDKFAEKTKKDSSKNPQALAKFLKEAARVKRVLSANADHQAQIEGLMDDVDFSTKVTRLDLETMCADIFDRIPEVVKQALLAANIGSTELQQVIIIGGGTRIPKVQERLLAALKRSELGKSLNSDEAVAMGAVYQAAHLSKGFRVKAFDLVDATVFPIVVEFERGSGSSSSDSEDIPNRLVKRALFARANGYPERKVLTFPKRTLDFNFTVRYADYEFLPAVEKAYMENGLSLKIGLTGVTEAFKKNEDKRAKGIKTHFEVDPSGVFVLDKAEAVFEYEKEEEVPSTMEKIGQSISNFFSGSKNNVTAENVTQSEKANEEINAATGAQSSNNSTESTPEEAGKIFSVTKVNKTLTIKEKLGTAVMRLDLADYPEKNYLESKKKLFAMDEKDRQKAEREKARNILETYIFDMQDKFYQSAYEKASTESEREDALKSFRAASEWLEEESAIQAADIYEKKLRGLKELVKGIVERVSEAESRPRVLADLEKHLNTSRMFLALTHNETVNDGLYTAAETANLEKLITETEEWRDSNVKLQEQSPPTKTPAFRVVDVVEKIRALDREVKYLLNKAKILKPKGKAEGNKAKKVPKSDNTSESTIPAPDETIPEGEEPVTEKEQGEYSFQSEDNLNQAQEQFGESPLQTEEDEDSARKDTEFSASDSTRTREQRTTHTPEL